MMCADASERYSTNHRKSEIEMCVLGVIIVAITITITTAPNDVVVDHYFSN